MRVGGRAAVGTGQAARCTWRSRDALPDLSPGTQPNLSTYMNSARGIINSPFIADHYLHPPQK